MIDKIRLICVFGTSATEYKALVESEGHLYLIHEKTDIPEPFLVKPVGRDGVQFSRDLIQNDKCFCCNSQGQAFYLISLINSNNQVWVNSYNRERILKRFFEIFDNELKEVRE